MIEGLRLLPWWQEAHRRKSAGVPDKCSTCMETQSDEQRRLLGCGYLTPFDDARAKFVNRVPPLGCNTELTVCPGYSTNLPEVVEISRARLHWSKGSLRDFSEGRPHEMLVGGIEILEGASNDCERWTMENREKKGGA